MGDNQHFCLTLRPSKEEFSRPFTDYVREVARNHPNLAMFKVVPPRGWSARTSQMPDLSELKINTPIKQHVFGTRGAYRCLFEEQKEVSVAEFKRIAYSPTHATPPKGHRKDDLLERAFWSAVTINPPLYGADTPVSFFDEKLEFGWNLRHLNCLLADYDVPDIPGVTTPMTYFGMWKSFFSWHVEDIDLHSINYLHFGAPKVWYSVSPKDRSKFEQMARSLFPELDRECPAFLRHKDILLSPKVLKTYHIDYVQAKQEVGEFIVLNAGAYHSGFNLGFNCAEAVNFATPEWLPAGKTATRCTCTALPDSVRLDMHMFNRGPRASKRLREAQEEESDSEDEEEGSSSDEDESEEEKRSPGRPAKQLSAAKRGAAGRAGRGGKRMGAGRKRLTRSGASAKPGKTGIRLKPGPKKGWKLRLAAQQAQQAAGHPERKKRGPKKGWKLALAAQQAAAGASSSAAAADPAEDAPQERNKPGPKKGWKLARAAALEEEARKAKQAKRAEQPKERKKPGPKPGWKLALQKAAQTVEEAQPAERKKPGPKPGWKLALQKAAQAVEDAQPTERKKPGPKPGWKLARQQKEAQPVQKAGASSVKKSGKKPGWQAALEARQAKRAQRIQQALRAGAGRKRALENAAAEQPKERKKPGPKPGWKLALQKAAQAVEEAQPKERKKPGRKPGWKKALAAGKLAKPKAAKLTKHGKPAWQLAVEARQAKRAARKAAEQAQQGQQAQQEGSAVTERKKPGPKPGWKQRLAEEKAKAAAEAATTSAATAATSSAEAAGTERRKPGPKPGWKKRLQEAQAVKVGGVRKVKGKPGPQKGWKLRLAAAQAAAEGAGEAPSSAAAAGEADSKVAGEADSKAEEATRQPAAAAAVSQPAAKVHWRQRRASLKAAEAAEAEEKEELLRIAGLSAEEEASSGSEGQPPAEKRRPGPKPGWKKRIAEAVAASKAALAVGQQSDQADSKDAPKVRRKPGPRKGWKLKLALARSLQETQATSPAADEADISAAADPAGSAGAASPADAAGAASPADAAGAAPSSPEAAPTSEVQPVPAKRKPGRPRKHPLPDGLGEQPAALTKQASTSLTGRGRQGQPRDADGQFASVDGWEPVDEKPPVDQAVQQSSLDQLLAAGSAAALAGTSQPQQDPAQGDGSPAVEAAAAGMPRQGGPAVTPIRRRPRKPMKKQAPALPPSPEQPKPAAPAVDVLLAEGRPKRGAARLAVAMATAELLREESGEGSSDDEQPASKRGRKPKRESSDPGDTLPLAAKRKRSSRPDDGPAPQRYGVGALLPVWGIRRRRGQRDGVLPYVSSIQAGAGVSIRDSSPAASAVPSSLPQPGPANALLHGTAVTRPNGISQLSSLPPRLSISDSGIPYHLAQRDPLHVSRSSVPQNGLAASSLRDRDGGVTSDYRQSHSHGSDRRGAVAASEQLPSTARTAGSDYLLQAGSGMHRPHGASSAGLGPSSADAARIACYGSDRQAGSAGVAGSRLVHRDWATANKGFQPRTLPSTEKMARKYEAQGDYDSAARVRETCVDSQRRVYEVEVAGQRPAYRPVGSDADPPAAAHKRARLAGDAADASASTSSGAQHQDTSRWPPHTLTNARPGQQWQVEGGGGPETNGIARSAIQWIRGIIGGQGPAAPGLSAHPMEDEAPSAIVGEDDRTGERFFSLVQRLPRPPKRGGMVVLRGLLEGDDGIYRPTEEVFEQPQSTLIQVQTQYVAPRGGQPAGFKLLTVPKRILAYMQLGE